jgi:hypothetical protein
LNFCKVFVLFGFLRQNLDASALFVPNLSE